MLKEQLSGNTMFMDAIDSWQEAIRVSARPLIGKGIIEESYVQAMIQMCWITEIILYYCH